MPHPVTPPDSEHIPASGPRNLALGIERIGLFSLRFPIVVAVVSCAARPRRGRLQRLKVDDSLSQLFRSDTPEYQTY